jgi:hypothetical protein
MEKAMSALSRSERVELVDLLKRLPESKKSPSLSGHFAKNTEDAGRLLANASTGAGRCRRFLERRGA